MSENLRMKFGGMLCDDHVHMTAEELSRHKTKEWYHERRQALRKLAGNPILSEEAKKEIRLAMYYMDDHEWLLKRLGDLQEQNSNLKKIAYGNVLERQEAQKKLGLKIT